MTKNSVALKKKNNPQNTYCMISLGLILQDILQASEIANNTSAYEISL